MPNATLRAESEAERHVWELLTRNFPWDPPAHLGVKVRRKDDGSTGPVRLQVFEIAVAAVFAQMQPEYEWYVTPNLPDGGSDFVGRQHFLVDDLLDIAAAVTVGGQCKKRTRVDNVVEELSGSLVNMMATINPTFFVVAFSARLTKERIKEACSRIENAHHRHCHILDRAQIEGLFRAHLPVLHEIISEALSVDQVEEVHNYLGGSGRAGAHESTAVSTPPRVLSGVPFGVTVEFPAFVGAAPDAKLWWRPKGGTEPTDAPVTLIGPIGADSPEGMSLASVATDDPIHIRCPLELLTHSVGNIDLGEILIGPSGCEGGDAAEWTSLGIVQVVENLSPRFYERPLRGALGRLESEYERALAGVVASVGIVGAGGSGKSRLSEEFALRQRRRGAAVVVAKQAKTLDDPHRILADLFLGLVGDAPSLEDPAERVVRAVEQYDPALAERTGAAIKSLFGLEDGDSTKTEQDLLSALLLLVAARGRRAPLIIHLQELHWCSADVLLLLERLVWQLGRVFPAFGASERSSESGVLFIFEGRIRERQRLGEDGWDSEPFEALLQKLDCPTVTCSFDPEQGLEFIRRLFEDRHSAHRRVNLDLLEMQRELVERIHRAAGGNPFHSLEQLQLLKERRIVGQNHVTGFLFLIQPAPSSTLLPESVFEAIKLRWTYMKSRTPELALLVWGMGLLDDRMPTPLFRRLWAELAPDVSLGDIDGTEMLWTGEDDDDEVAFRHENYFESIRRFEVSKEDRERAVKVYCEWFAETEQADRPVDRFKWGLALLQLPVPDEDQAEALMRSALRGAQDRGDLRLARRVQAASLDLAWRRDERSPVEAGAFLRHSEEELWLTNELLGSGDRSRAARRLTRLSGRLEGRVSGGQPSSSTEAVAELRRLQLTAEVRRSQILFNDRKPVEAAELAMGAVRSIRSVRSGKGFDRPAWEELEMEALHSEAVALAISGDIEPSLTTSAEAVELARRSSSVLAQHVISTYANILMSRDPETSESILRQCLVDLDETVEAVEARVSARINLAMTLVIQAHRLDPDETDARQALLEEAEEILKSVFSRAFQLGRYPDAGAGALMLGVISAMQGDSDEVSWFAQAVAAAARGRQMETLWRAHINLATAMSRSGDAAAEDVRDHAVAALEILEETLSPYPEPDRSPRFELVQVSLAQAVRFLHATDAASARAVLERYPALRLSFEDAGLNALKEAKHDGWRHEWWLWVNGEPYSLY